MEGKEIQNSSSILTSEDTKLIREQAVQIRAQFAKDSFARSSIKDSLLRKIVGKVVKMPHLATDTYLIQSAQTTNRQYWETGSYGSVHHEVADAQEVLLANAWEHRGNDIKTNQGDGYFRVGLENIDTRFKFDTDIKLHVNPRAEDVPAAALAMTIARERLKVLGIECGLKIAIANPAYKQGGEASENPPRIVMYPYTQDPEKLKQVVAAMNEALQAAQITNDKTYTPRYSTPLGQDSPIYAVQGDGRKKSRDPEYRARYGSDGMANEAGLAIINQLKQ